MSVAAGGALVGGELQPSTSGSRPKLIKGLV
jgi:hypothetical protein